MKTTIFEQVQAQTGLSAANLEQFLVSYVLESARRACKGNGGETYSWELASGANVERRLILGYDNARSEINVSFEVTTQLFAGDTHFFVKTVDTVCPAEIDNLLPGIVTKALEQVNGYKPTYEMF